MACRYSKQAKVAVAERNALLTEKQTALSLAVWRAARALEALNNCTNSTQCIIAYEQSLRLVPMRNTSVKVAITSGEENEIMSPASSHQWVKTPQLVLQSSTDPLLPLNNSTSGTDAPVSPVTTSDEGRTSSGQCSVASMCAWWLLMVLTCISMHF